MVRSKVNKIFNISIPFTDKSFGFYIQNNKKSKKRSKKRNINYKLISKIEFLVIVVGIILQIAQLVNNVPAVKEAITLATTVKPETFTELYFENHLSLPSKMIYNEDNKFKFTIHNLEYKNMTYPYEVYIKCLEIGCNGEKQMIDEGKITLKHDEYKTIPESFTLTLPTGKIQVVANLINKNQQISFWLNGANDAVQSQASPETAQSQPSLKVAQPQSFVETVQPATFTELYFDNQLPLPLTVTPNQTVNFAFTVHDFEYQDVTYPYEVYLEENGQTTQIDKGQFSLKQNEYRTITESYALTTPVQLAKIFVKLNNENRYIYFEIKGTQ